MQLLLENDDLLLLIFTRLALLASPHDILRLCRVARRWAATANAAEVWKQLVLTTFPRVRELLRRGASRPESVAWKQIFREQQAAQAAKVRFSTPPLSSYLFSFDLTVSVGNAEPVLYSQTVPMQLGKSTRPQWLQKDDPVFATSEDSIWTAASQPQWLQDFPDGLDEINLTLDIYLTRNFHTVCVYERGKVTQIAHDGFDFDMQELLPPWNTWPSWPLARPPTPPIELQPDLLLDNDGSWYWKVYWTAEPEDFPLESPPLEHALRFLEYVTMRAH